MIRRLHASRGDEEDHSRHRENDQRNRRQNQMSMFLQLFGENAEERRRLLDGRFALGDADDEQNCRTHVDGERNEEMKHLEKQVQLLNPRRVSNDAPDPIGPVIRVVVQETSMDRIVDS